MYFLQHYRSIKRYLKTCKYITWFINLLIFGLFLFSIYIILIKLPLYSCYQEAKLLDHDLDIIVLTKDGCGTIIKNEFIPLKDL